MAELTQRQMHTLSRLLARRYVTLVQTAREQLQHAGDDDHLEPFGRVLDGGEAAVAETMAALHEAGAERAMREVRAIIDAGNRLRHGTYGDCADCGEAIPFERLQQLPIAERCVDCQDLHERDFGRGPAPTL